MTVYVALLRAVNVGGRWLKMAELVTLFHDNGYADARSHIQSGNVIFTAPERSATGLAAKLEAAIVARFAMQVDVILRSAADMKRVVARNPFPEMAEKDPAHLVVVFLPAEPDASGKAWLKQPWSGPETWKLVGADLYVIYPQGIGPTKLKLRLKPPGTARNWKVVCKLAALAAGA